MRLKSMAIASAVAIMSVLLLTGAPAAAQSAAKTYSGRATVTVHLYDPCGGSGRVVQTYRLTHPAKLIIGPRLSYGGRTELSPFSWKLVAGNAAADLAAEFWSAAISNPGSGRVLLGYWSLTRKADGTVSGRLLDSHQREGVALNLINAPKFINPCAPGWGSFPFMYGAKEGSRISGKITSRSARLTVTGVTLGHEYGFKVVFST